MDRRVADADGASVATPIVLARTSVFTVAHLTITPAALSVRSGDWAHSLEPRAMQVLVALADAAPAVVGRAELRERAWGGRVVGEDAVNRAIQMLRRLAKEAPPPAPFSIETVPRVGYQLVIGPSAVPDDLLPGDVPAAPGTVRPQEIAGASPERRGRAVAAVGLLAGVAALVAWVGRDRLPSRSTGWRVTGSSTLSDLPPDARDAALSPDGRRLAYRRADGGRERIYVRATGGDGVGRAISPASLDARRPAWSPDGAAVAFSAYDPRQPCRLMIWRPGAPASEVGACETVREARLAWSADGRALMFGDSSGVNAVQRITAVSLPEGRREVLSSPPADSSMGDELPVARAGDIAFQRRFGFADEGWIARDRSSGRERLLWRGRGVSGSIAAPLPGGSLAIAWTRAGASGLDIVGRRGVVSEPVALGPPSEISSAGARLLLGADRTETALVAGGEGATSPPPLAVMRGQIASPLILHDRRLLFAATFAGVSRVWERGADGVTQPWGPFIGARIVGLTASPDERFVSAMVTTAAGREIVVFDARGRATFHWNPHARSVGPAAWSLDGRRLIVPIIDGQGWRLFEVDPVGGVSPRDIDQPGFALVARRGKALYAVRAGEATGIRELWRLDGAARRLPIDLTLFDIVNWAPDAQGVWLPERTGDGPPRLVLRDGDSGRVLRRLAAPGLAGAGSGLAADERGPVYVRTVRSSVEYSLLRLAPTR